MKKLITLIAIFIGIHMMGQPAGWSYNQPIIVNNPNSQNAVNYQLRLTVNTQSIIALGRMNTNGDDIRFGAPCNAPTLFNYWIEAGINTPTTVIWVKIPYIAANTSTVIFMFYGNPTATAVSSIPATFKGPNSSTDSVSGGTAGGVGNSQRGFRFQPNQNLLVTQFGKSEPTGTTRFVTLFDFSSSAIITQTQVAGATTSYTYNAIQPIWLNSGSQYVLQLFQGASDGYYFGTSSQIGQHLTYLDMRYCNSCTQNTFPTSVLSNYHYGYPDFLYYVTNTLVTTPTYTMNEGLGSITAPTVAFCGATTVTLTTNTGGAFTWNTGSTASLIVVSPTTTTNYYITSPTNTFMCPAVTVTVNPGPPTLTVAYSANTVCPGNTVIVTASGALTYSFTGGISNGVPFAPSATTSYTITGGNACGTGTTVATVTVAPLPVVGASSPTIVCSANTATLSATGATNYTWMPGSLTGSAVVVNPTAQVVYTLTGVSGSCSGVSTITLPVNPNPTISASASSSVICEGDQATITAIGGNNYTWTPGGNGPSITVTPTTTSLYSVTGDNSFGCTSSANQVLIVTAAPPVNVSTNKPNVCIGGSATLSANGAHTYSWNGGQTGTPIVVNPVGNTIYSVVGTNTNTGCSKTKTVSVNVFTPALVVSTDATICPGNSATLTASGANTYTWDTGWQNPVLIISPLTNTVQVISATTNSFGISCVSASTVAVYLYQLPAVTAAASKTAICRNEIMTFIAGGANTYTWSNLNTSPTFTLKGTSNITYSFTVTGTDSHSCTNTATASVKVNPCTTIEEVEQGDKMVNVFPNPTNGEFVISSNEDIELVIVDELGRSVRKLSITKDNSHRILVSGLANGIYFIKRQSDNLLLEKLVVNKQ
jgi:hypothetical protein